MRAALGTSNLCRGCRRRATDLHRQRDGAMRCWTCFFAVEAARLPLPPEKPKPLPGVAVSAHAATRFRERFGHLVENQPDEFVVEVIQRATIFAKKVDDAPPQMDGETFYEAEVERERFIVVLLPDRTVKTILTLDQARLNWSRQRTFLARSRG